MNKEDHDAFDKFLCSISGISIKHGKIYDEIQLFDGFIQYERSEQIKDVLIAGRVAIATTDLDGKCNFTSHQEIERLYKKLRSWIKKRSVNTLVCFNETLEDNIVQPVNKFWLCNGAASLVKSQNIKLKQFESGNVVFKLA